LCPPGGDDTVRRLAELLSKEPLPLAEPQPEGRSVAIIDEALCIGCTHCRSACPVDAIVGAHQFMHTIIESECTGCELCIAPCPVDCISLRRIA
jgi:electron transport complex protein RnfB